MVGVGVGGLEFGCGGRGGLFRECDFQAGADLRDPFLDGFPVVLYSN